MRNAHGDFIWYELMTPDPEGAKAFYDAVVGWRIGEAKGDPPYREIEAADGMAGGVLEMGEAMRQQGARPVWLGYIGVDDVDDAVSAIEHDGGRSLLPAFDIAGVGRIAMVTDPEGVPFYVMRGAVDAVSGAFSVDDAQHVRWNELTANDPDRSLGFYRRHFGWGQEGSMDMGELGQYRFLQSGAVTIGAIMPRPDGVPAPGWTFYIGVDDIDRAVSAIVEGGGRLIQGPMEIPGGEYAVNAIDPQGASFGLVGPRKQ